LSRAHALLRPGAVALTLCLGTIAAHAAGTITCAGQDATAAIQQAVNAGGTVQLSAGLCLVAAPIRIGSNTTLRGAGAGRTVLRAARLPDYPVIAVGGERQVSGAAGVDLSGFSVDAGNRVAIGAPGTNGIAVSWSSHDVVLHDLEVYGAGGNGIDARGSDILITHDRVHDNQANGIYVIGKGHPGRNDAVPASRVRIVANQVARNSLGRRPEMKHGWDGIDIDPITRDCLVENNHVTDNDIILDEDARVVPASSGHRVVGNTIEHVTQGFAGIDVAGPQADFAVIGNTIEGVLGTGIVINGPVRHGQVRDNKIGGASGPGIEIRDTGPTAHTGRPDDVTVAGNMIRQGPRQAAILVQHQARNVRITGNVVSGDGLGIVARGPLPGLQLSGNLVR
jgi:hypothetical protein